MVIFWLRMTGLVVVVALAGSAHAQAEAPEAAPPLAIAVECASLDVAALCAAIARELGRPVVVDAAGTAAELSVVVRAGHVRLRYHGARGEVLTRIVALPRDPGRAVERIALLAGNLARDQANELLRRYGRHAPTATATAPRLPPELASPSHRPAHAPSAAAVASPSTAASPSAAAPSAATTRAPPRAAAPSDALDAETPPPPCPPALAALSITRRPQRRDDAFAGRFGLYVAGGAGTTFRGSVLAPVQLGVALRGRLFAVAAEGLTGYSSGAIGGGDLMFMMHHTVGSMFITGGLGAGDVVARGEGKGSVNYVIGHAFVRISRAVGRALDLFTQLDLIYAHTIDGDLSQQGLTLSLGTQLRFLR